jgi:CubicO group peptidase (beta-lactamase class C family)
MRRAALLLTAALTAPLAALAAPLAADTPGATGSAVFTAPAGWTEEVGPDRTVLIPPEGDTHIVIQDVPQAKDAADAVAKVWRAYRPDFTRAPKLVTPLPPREGWEARSVLSYETSPNEHLFLQGAAFRRGAAWTVLIVEGSESTIEKRAAAANLVGKSVRPKGYEHESFEARPAHALDAQRVEALKSFVKTAMDELNVPGVGLALIDHGKVVYEGGLGVKALGRPDPVGAHTLFMIASNTKGMSTLLLAKLVDAGKLDWNAKVTNIYPSFRLGSEATTSKVLLRHLVCACTGLPRKDYDWLFNTRLDTPASTTFTQLAATEPTSGFGEVFQYNNLMASAAGYIAGHLYYPQMELGAAYDRAMDEQIFGPLGMSETTFDMKRALAGDHASPHGDTIDGRPALAQMAFNYAVEPYRPAGGAWSSPHDLIKYVQDEIAEGALPDGGRLVSAKNLLVRRAPNVATGENGEYGMGLETDHAWGVLVVHHGGSLAGYKSDIMLVPSAQVGAVILTNSDLGQLMLRPFMRRLLEVLYDGKPEAAGDVAAAASRYKAEIHKDRDRLVTPAAAEAAAHLADAYVNPDLGRLTVRREGGRTVFDFGLWKSEVASRKNDDGTLSLITIDPTLVGFEFVVAQSGGKRALTIRDGQHAYTYVEAS